MELNDLEDGMLPTSSNVSLGNLREVDLAEFGGRTSRSVDRAQLPQRSDLGRYRGETSMYAETGLPFFLSTALVASRGRIQTVMNAAFVPF